MSVRILVVDDHFVVRQGIRGILVEAYPGAVFGEASNGNEALEMALKHPWDIVLLDVSMPGRGGLDALKDLRQQFPKLPIIVMSMHPEEQFALRMIKLGASSYICKDSVSQELLKGVEAALRGRRYITPSLAAKLAENLQKGTDGPLHDLLANREYQVLLLLGAGKTVKEAANDLSLSVKTISTYRTRIFEKMGFKNNAHLIAYVIEHGLLAGNHGRISSDGA